MGCNGHFSQVHVRGVVLRLHSAPFSRYVLSILRIKSCFAFSISTEYIQIHSHIDGLLSLTSKMTSPLSIEFSLMSQLSSGQRRLTAIVT